jgi:predicted secreted protein
MFYCVTYTRDYTITPQSGNESHGTVSLEDNVITATPASGYRVSTTTPYTIAPEGKATVTQEGNTFTVTDLTDNVTITINFEANPSTGIIPASVASAAKVYAINGAIVIDGAQGATASVITPLGVTVYKNTVDGNSKKIPVNPGIYIVSINGKAVKVVVK